MDTLSKIQNTFKSFEGRIKVLEHDPNVDLETYCTKAARLEHDFYNAVKRILENDGRAENVSSVELAKRYGLINE